MNTQMLITITAIVLVVIFILFIGQQVGGLFDDLPQG